MIRPLDPPGLSITQTTASTIVLNAARATSSRRRNGPARRRLSAQSACPRSSGRTCDQSDSPIDPYFPDMSEKNRMGDPRTAASTGSRAHTPRGEHDHGERDGDDDRVVEILKVVVPAVPVATGLVADHREQQHPGDASECG
jgi:hypothetical protein